MESFLGKFFPKVLTATKNAQRNIYCKYDNQSLTVFTSSLLITAALSSLIASHVTRRVGRQGIMLIGSTLFLAGSIINAGAVTLPCSSSVACYSAVVLGLPFSLLQCICLRQHRQSGGVHSPRPTMPSVLLVEFLQRNSIPGITLAIGTFFVSDTPSSLVLRGHIEQARATLQRIRGMDADVDSELKDIVRAVDQAHRNEDGAFKRLFSKEYRQMAILGSVINTVVNLVATVLSSFIMDHTGRRSLFVVGGLGMVFCEVANSWIMAAHLGAHGVAVTMPHNYAIGVLMLILLLTFSMGVSWAPLRWVVQSEIYPVEVRSAGQAVSISVWLCLTFLELQVFIKMLCTMKHGVFLFHACCLLVATVFVALFLPETKGVPLEMMQSVWARHWYWRRYVKNDKQERQDNCL
ncbi:unnamed protein product [Urochloa decumbens]|uniref:Major facilitator superfamily (MFS) profile domain-containing protein n=1 Tax=Urochloa decumbens TaxID=240449 RepID=A0ABC9FIW9_9POAL